MATKDTITVAYFQISSFGLRGNKRAHDVAHGSSDVDHAIEIENGSTLPYDVRVKTVLPDAPPQDPSGVTDIEFSYNAGAQSPDWLADIAQIGSGDIQKRRATMHCVATSPGGSERIHSPTLEYRLDATDAWQSDATVTKTLSIEMPIS